MADDPTASPETLLQRLRAQFPSAKVTTLRQMLTDHRVLLNGQPARSLKQPLVPADTLTVSDQPAHTQPLILAAGLRIVHADAHVLLIEKPHGLLSATDAREKRPTALKILTAYYQKKNAKNQIHLVHRLDRDASGLLLFARSWNAFRSLKQQFFEHSITRRYDALVRGIPKKSNARLENLLAEDPHTGIVRPTTDMKNGKLAILDYTLLRSNAPRRIAHLQCTLFTGRKHQIRVQLLALGHPVLADPLYALPRQRPTPEEPPGRLALHASHLTFVHPATGRPLSFDSPMPGSFAHLLRS